jgi:hypothetical protein
MMVRDSAVFVIGAVRFALSSFRHVLPLAGSASLRSAFGGQTRVDLAWMRFIHVRANKLQYVRAAPSNFLVRILPLRVCHVCPFLPLRIRDFANKQPLSKGRTLNEPCPSDTLTFPEYTNLPPFHRGGIVPRGATHYERGMDLWPG